MNFQHDTHYDTHTHTLTTVMTEMTLNGIQMSMLVSKRISIPAGIANILGVLFHKYASESNE